MSLVVRLQETALAALDAEIVSLNDAAAAAESRAAVLENTVTTAKDQLLRLNADFDNFRRRSVSPSGVCGAAAHAQPARGGGSSGGSSWGRGRQGDGNDDASVVRLSASSRWSITTSSRDHACQPAPSGVATIGRDMPRHAQKAAGGACNRAQPCAP